MAERTIQLVLHYDGARFAGWQRQPKERTVQGVLEETLSRLCDMQTAVVGAGRTDAGVHARGQAAGTVVPHKWEAAAVRRALNALLPRDVWVAAAHDMHPEFHARYSATARRYRYFVGIDDEAHSPFRRPREWAYRGELSVATLRAMARAVTGDHCFRAFAVKGTAHASDDHRCIVRHAAWHEGPGMLIFEIEANRFLHHMVRFLVGTMLEIGSGRLDDGAIERLLAADDNRAVPAPAPAHALFLERVEYPRELYLVPT